MASRVRPLNLTDFTGGLNMRGDSFQLAANESPNMLNVEIDRRGGFAIRKGWTRWNDGDIDTPWNPRTMFIHERSDGTDRVFVVNDGAILYSTDGDTPWTTMATAAPAADPHGADFAQWGDIVYIACGNTGSNPSIQLAADLTVSSLTQAEGANFSTPDSPTTAFPHCTHVASHQGYMFAACTEESGVVHPNRLRFSHPNNPVGWATDDYFDILEGGGHITGIVPQGDRLLIFQQSSIWALYGYDADSWQLVNISRERGALHRQAIARSEHAVFFYCNGEGVFGMEADDGTPVEISEAIRPIFQSSDFVTGESDNIWLGWVDQKLWCSFPWDETTLATDAANIFVFDPSLGSGAWLRHQCADGLGVGPFGHGGFGGGAGLHLACARSVASVLQLDGSDNPLDDLDGTPEAFESFYTTPWVDAGHPTLKKSWRRPDFVVKRRTHDYDIDVDVFRDYDEGNVVRDRVLSVPAGATGALWGSFVWGDGTIYGPPAEGSTIIRGGSLGSARAVQLRLTGEPEKLWGVDAIALKVIPRRLR